MADFCLECSETLFGKDFGDLSGLCPEGKECITLCEGCGWVTVDYRGKRIRKLTEEEVELIQSEI